MPGQPIRLGSSDACCDVMMRIMSLVIHYTLFSIDVSVLLPHLSPSILQDIIEFIVTNYSLAGPMDLRAWATKVVERSLVVDP